MNRKTLLGMTLWLLLAGTCLAADDYLSVLEAEADDTATRSGQVEQQVSEQPARKKASVAGQDTIREGLTFAGFEEELNTNYSGSYFLYAKLNERKRKAVYRFYEKDNRVEAIREEIVRQLSSG